MSRAKLKNLIIAVLVILNIFLLADILFTKVTESTEQSKTTQALQAILVGEGIALHDGVIIESGAPASFNTSHDSFGEATIAGAVLGDCELDETEVGQSYTGERGTAVFINSSDFVITLTADYSPGGSVARAASKLLRSMKIETTTPQTTVYGGTEVVTALCTWEGSVIFNCTVSFTFTDGKLIEVVGRRPSSVAEATGTGTIELPTAILSLVRYIRAGNADCTEIVSIEAGYRMHSVGAHGDGELVPGWLLITDSGSYFVEATTGEITRNDA